MYKTILGGLGQASMRRTQKTMDNIETKYHVIHSWWLLSQEKASSALQSGWISSTSVTSNGVVKCYL